MRYSCCVRDSEMLLLIFIDIYLHVHGRWVKTEDRAGTVVLNHHIYVHSSGDYIWIVVQSDTGCDHVRADRYDGWSLR